MHQSLSAAATADKYQLALSFSSSDLSVDFAGAAAECARGRREVRCADPAIMKFFN